jgi:hypothetical protein
MGRAVALIISTIFHPVFINLLSTCILFAEFPQLYFGMPATHKLYYIAFIFITTSIIPMVIVALLRMSGRIKSIMLEERAERQRPYFFTLILYLFDAYYFSRAGAPMLIIYYLAACAVIVFVLLSVSFFYKMSIHAASLGSMIGMLIVGSKLSPVDIRMMLFFAFVITGLVGSARMFAGSHTSNQVYSGFAVGFLLMFFIL